MRTILIDEPQHRRRSSETPSQHGLCPCTEPLRAEAFVSFFSERVAEGQAILVCCFFKRASGWNNLHTNVSGSCVVQAASHQRIDAGGGVSGRV